jgi:sugar/nucleoside kinase (ribokinase family)
VSYAAGRSIADSLELACAASALSTLKLGAQSGMPTKREVDDFIANSK